MKSAILRTGSIPIQNLNRTPAHSGSIPSSPRVSFRSENIKYGNLKRSSSDTDLIRPGLACSRVGRVGSVSIPDLGVIVEEESSGGIGIGIGNGKGKGNDYGRKGKVGNDESNDKCKIEEYYEEMLNSNPGNSLLLRNYGKYLHQVKKNAEKAEEYYGRAILANPGDGELLSLYGDLIWETSKDEHRAQLYFDQAVTASPNDCMVLGSYAHFLWEVEDDDDQSTCINHENVGVPRMVGVH